MGRRPDEGRGGRCRRRASGGWLRWRRWRQRRLRGRATTGRSYPRRLQPSPRTGIDRPPDPTRPPSRRHVPHGHQPRLQGPASRVQRPTGEQTVTSEATLPAPTLTPTPPAMSLRWPLPLQLQHGLGGGSPGAGTMQPRTSGSTSRPGL